MTSSPLFGQSLLEKFGLLMLGDELLRRLIVQRLIRSCSL
jgi:hypothetical protein